MSRGKETVQLYVRDLVGFVVRPVKQLIGFQQVFLKKGETKELTFTIGVDDLKFYDYNVNLIAEPGDFEVFVGGNSATELKKMFTLL